MVESLHSSGALPDVPRLLIERAHAEFIAGNREDRRIERVRPLVRDSWVRSLHRNVAPEEAPRLELEGEELEAYRREHPLATAMDLIRELLLPGTVEDSGVIVAVSDHTGRVLWIDGDGDTRTLTSEAGLIEGTNWSEEAIGTSALGTALALGHSVQIRGPEHYNRLVHPWSCTAAPIYDPETRRVVGVIDITGTDQAASAQARLLVDATARAAESHLLVTRLREHIDSSRSPTVAPRAKTTVRAVLHVLGRDTARLETETDLEESVIDISARHAAILLMLAVHRQGLSAERLTELVYGPGVSPDTVRPEMVRLRKVLAKHAPDLVPESRPYRLPLPLETDAHDILALLDRGAHRLALAAYRGPVLPGSRAPGVEEFREAVSSALREAMLTEASLDVLLAYADIPEGQSDSEALRLALELLPARSPRRGSIVTRIERLDQER